jgi:nitroreductase
LRREAGILSGVTEPDPTVLPDLDRFGGLVRARRTHMLVDRDREVPPALIAPLCELATWAPNHKRTWPWRFASFTGDARARLGEAFVADMTMRDFGDQGKRDKTLTKYLRTPNVLVVGCAPHTKPSLHNENRDAVAAAVQTLLLAATASGVASYWSTAPLIDSPRALALCGFADDDRIIAVIYLGWPNGTVEAPARPQAIIRHLA